MKLALAGILIALALRPGRCATGRGYQAGSYQADGYQALPDLLSGARVRSPL